MIQRAGSKVHSRRTRLLGVALLLVCLACLAPVPLLAAEPDGSETARGGSLAQQGPPQGQIVEAIEVSGNQRLEDETVRFYMSTRVGAPFDWTTALQDYRALLNTRFFDNLAMRWRPGDTGVVVMVEVDERPLLRRVRIDGTEKVSRDDLLERMEKIEMPIEEDSPVDRQRLRRAREVLTTMLQGEEGLQFVQVDLAFADSTEGAGIDALFDVVEGDAVRIEQVYFEGATVFTQRELRWQMKRTGEHWLLSFLTKNDRFSWAGFEQDMFGLMNLYRKLGYLDFTFDEPRVEVYEVERPLFFDATDRLFVTIPVNEGSQYRLGTVSFEGNEFYSDEQLQILLPLQSGDVLDVEQLLAAKDAMEAVYKNAGYLEVFVAPRDNRNPETGIADITFQINENDVYYVRRINFEGNTNTRDHVLRRSLRIHETDRWNDARFNASLFKIYQLGYFDDVEPELNSEAPATADQPDTGSETESNGTEEPGAEQEQGASQVKPTGEVDVTIKLKEVGRNQISFGGGVSALEGGFIQFGYTTRNLFGRGQTMSFFGQFGARRTNARLSFLQPYMFDRAVRFGFDVFRDSIDFFDFQREGTGISTRVGFPLDEQEFLNFFIEYNYEFIDVGTIPGTFLGLRSPVFRSLFFTQGETTTSSVRPFFVYNTVDNPFSPSRGKRFVGSFEIAGGVLGGTLDFWKATASNTFYIPTVRRGRGVATRVKQLIAINAELWWSGAYGELDEVPIFERFFLGGSQSIRGTRLRAVGPVDEFGNILGGDKALQYNIEYIFQLADPLRLAVFHDGGQAWDPSNNFDLTELRKTAGVEFRVFVPMFNVPFRFFWAYNFDPLPEFGEDRSTFEFAIGSTF